MLRTLGFSSDIKFKIILVLVHCENVGKKSSSQPLVLLRPSQACLNRGPLQMIFLVFHQNQRQIGKTFSSEERKKKKDRLCLFTNAPVCDHLTVIIIYAKSLKK